MDVIDISLARLYFASYVSLAFLLLCCALHYFMVNFMFCKLLVITTCTVLCSWFLGELFLCHICIELFLVLSMGLFLFQCMIW
jgi:hypothetical protein